MKAIILAGGENEIAGVPVPKIEIEGERLLDIQISCLRNVGAEEIEVVINNKFQDVERADVGLTIISCDDSKGAIASLLEIAEVFDGAQDIIISYGDIVAETEVLRTMLRSHLPVSAVCYLDRSDRDLGVYREYAVIEDGALKEVTESDAGHGVRTVFTGLVYIKKEKVLAVSNFLKKHLLDERRHVGELLNKMLEFGVDVAPVIVEHGWVEVSSQLHYDEMLKQTGLLEKVIQIHTDWTQRAKGYDRLDWVNNDSLLKEIVGVAKNCSPQTILDVGTGTGKVLRALRDSCNAKEHWGVDYSMAMLDKIEDKAGLTLSCGDAETLEGVPNDYFDVVTARMVFHHIDDVQKAMASIKRVLKKGGTFIICEGVPPTIRSVQWYTEMFRYKEDRKTLTEVDLINNMLVAGFESINTSTVTIHNASLNNWLDNSGIPQKNIDIIKKMHFEAPAAIVEDYNMKMEDGDCLMTWRFAVTYGQA